MKKIALVFLLSLLALPQIQAATPYDWIGQLQGKELFILLLLMFLVFLIVFEILAKALKFHRQMSALIAFAIAIAAFALKQTQDIARFIIAFGAGLGAASIFILVGLAFLYFILINLGVFRKRRH